MSVPSGWYADPWHEGPFRWWDGTKWTGVVTGSAGSNNRLGADAEAAVPTKSGLAQLLGKCDRIAVVDVETTGLYNSDRIVEVAIVTIDLKGKVIDEFETLIQPLRDVGPTWLHGIDARMLRDAPTFADVAQHVAARVDGAVVAAHNLPFDTRMVGNELASAGIDIDWGFGLDTLRATGCKLGQACAEHNVPLVSAHSAIADARATAQLVITVAEAFRRACVPASARPLHVTAKRVCRRDGHARAEVPAPYLAALAEGVRTSSNVAPYAELVGLAIADLQLTDLERRELRALAADIGLDDREVKQAHREFLNGLIDAAVEDQVVTNDELDRIRRAAALLDIEVEHVARRTDPFRAATKALNLKPGMSVCFTGFGRLDNGNVVDRAAQADLAKTHGFVVVDSITKAGPDLLVAGDGDSRSGKARKARQYGVPICEFNNFLRAVETGEPVTVACIASTGIAQVCVECGASWIAPRRATRPVCGECSGSALLGVRERSAQRRPRPTSPRPKAMASSTTVGELETLICFDCGARWQRPRSRGRRPGQCPDCRAGSQGQVGRADVGGK